MDLSYPPSSVPNEFSAQWLYNNAAQLWAHWLPTETLETIKKRGYYTLKIADHLRVIALNNNEANVNNFWLINDATYLKEQLQWLHDTLLTAEQNHEKVHILRHIPLGRNKAYRYWMREYNRIVNRFYKTITAQFDGHTHKNELNIFYDKSGDFAINAAFNGGSLTPNMNVNPNYVVYRVDQESFEVLDFDVYYTNLTKANLEPNQAPGWSKLYTFKEKWEVPDLSPKSLNNLVDLWTIDQDSLLEVKNMFISNFFINSCLLLSFLVLETTK